MKVVQKTVKQSLGDTKDISEMFNQMLGAGALNIIIAYPKYINMKNAVENLVRLFDAIQKSPFLTKTEEFKRCADELNHFVSEARKQIDYWFGMQLEEPANVTDEQRQKFTELYEGVKKSSLVNQFIIMCDKLVVYKNYFNDENNLNDKFLTNMVDPEFKPFPFSNLNLKYIFTMCGPNTKKFFMTILHKSFIISHTLWKVVTSPDVDVDQFVKIIMSNIDQIQNRPELGRCKDAFDKIKESVHMLKDNFSGYYRNFISTKDSTIIMQNFIIDVSKNQSNNPKVIKQFQKIVRYYQTMASSQIKNDKAKQLFEKVNEAFKQIEKNTTNLVDIGEDVPPMTADDAADPGQTYTADIKAKSLYDIE